MLPSNVSDYLPHIGLFFLLMALIFIVISATSYPSSSSSSGASHADVSNVMKYQSLATIFAAVGGFLLLGPIH